MNRCDRAYAAASAISNFSFTWIAYLYRQYEDRGTVDDKGDVQITRKYLQSKKVASTSFPPTQSDSNRGRKKIPPICPPNGSNSQTDLLIGKPTSRSCNATRYSTMLAMSAMDDSLSGGDKKPQVVLTDINDNDVQPLDGYCHFQDKTQEARRKKDADNFPNFDMWNSNLMPPLSNSPTNSGSSKAYESLDKMSSVKSPRDWENGAEYPPPQLLSFNGYSSDSGVSNCNSYYNFPANKTVDQSRPMAAVRYQNLPAYYVLLQPPAYLRSKDVIPYPQPPVVVHHARDAYDCRSYEQIRSTVTDPGPVKIGEKLGDYEFWRGGGLTKTGNNDATSHLTNVATSCYVQNYAPNLVLNLAPICAPAENATSCFVPLDMATSNDEKRPRPILKQEKAACAQLWFFPPISLFSFSLLTLYADFKERRRFYIYFV